MWCYIVLIVSCMMINADDHTFFTQANLLYQQGSYAEALNMYEQLQEQTPAVFYNMGNAAYQLHDYMHAYLYWLRAQQHGNAKIFAASTNNLKLLADQGLIEHQDQYFIWFWSLSKYIAFYWWQLFMLMLWSALVVMIYKRYYSWHYHLLCAFGLMALSLPLFIGYYAATPRAMIIADAPVYNGPNSLYYKLATLSKGKIVTIKKIEKSWIKIIADEHIGWVDQEYVVQI